MSVRFARITEAALSPAGKSFFANSTGMVLAFCSQIILARIMGAAEFGIYMYALAWANMLVFIGKFGFDTVALRFVPVYLERHDPHAAGAFLRYAVSRAAVVSFILVIVAGVVLFALKRMTLVGDHVARTLAIAMMTIPTIAITLVVAGQLQARQRVLLAQGLPNVGRPLLITMFVVALAVGGIAVSAQVAMTFTVAAVIVILSVIASCARADFGTGRRSATQSVQDRPQWNAAARSFVVITSFTLLLSQCDLQILGLFQSGEDIGIYAAASRLAVLVPFTTNAANSALAPEIARRHSNRDLSGIRAAIGSASRWTIAASIAMSIVLVAAAKPVLGIFGAEFRDGSTVLFVLVTARLLMALTGLGGHLLNMTGHHARAARIVVIAASAQTAACFMLIPPFGTMGAAGAALAGAAIWSVLTVYSCRRLVGVNPVSIHGR